MTTKRFHYAGATLGGTAVALVASVSFVHNGASGPIVRRLADRWGEGAGRP